MKESYKIGIFDLDDTLIKTASGKKFAEDPTDFRIRKDVLDRIASAPEFKDMQYILIASNQGGIPEYISEEEFNAKMEAIKAFIIRYTGKCPLSAYCASRDDENVFRKPNTGMLEFLMNKLNRMMRDAEEPEYTKDDCIMIGDASGKDGDFADSDKMTAENFGIDYMDVEDFLHNSIFQGNCAG